MIMQAKNLSLIMRREHKIMGRNANGQGSFEVLPNKKVRMRKQCGYTSNGKPKILTVTGDTKSACIRAMKVKEDEWIKVRNTEASILVGTLAELCYRHLEYDKVHKKNFKPTAVDRRECTIRNQIEDNKYKISRLQVQSITSVDVKEHIYGLIDEQKLSASSIEKTFNVINAAFKWAVDNEYVSKNVCISIKEEIMSEIRAMTDIEDANIKKVKALSPSQIKVFEETCLIRNANNGRHKYEAGLYGLFLLYTGLRCGELCALRYSDIKEIDGKTFITIDKTRSVIKNRDEDVERKYVEHEGNTKNVKVRNLELSEIAIQILKEIKESSPFTKPDDYVVLNKNYKPTNPSKLGKCINTIYKNAKFSDTISGAHVLRKTFATQRYKAGYDVPAIATYLGDTPETVWKHYISDQESIDAGEEAGEFHYVAALK